VRSDGSKTCEILEVYSAIERERLKQLDSVRVASILHVGENDVNTNIKFSSVGSTMDTKRAPNRKKNTSNEVNVDNKAGDDYDDDDDDDYDVDDDDVDSMVQPDYNDLSDDDDEGGDDEGGDDDDDDDCECDSNGNYIVKTEVDVIKK